MRDSADEREIALGETPSTFPPQNLKVQGAIGDPLVSISPNSLRDVVTSELRGNSAGRSLWVFLPQGLVRRPMEEIQSRPLQSFGFQVRLPNKPIDVAGSAGMSKQDSPAPGVTLYQESFFFCRIAHIGDVHGAGCIYVETAVEPESGMAFAKVYAARNSMYAVDLIADRALPFFSHRGIAIDEIRTPKTREYCGLPPAHPYETFLATSQIQHANMDKANEPNDQVCERFYGTLLSEFFRPELRKRFAPSFDELQEDLDAFVDEYNSGRAKRFEQAECVPAPACKF